MRARGGRARLGRRGQASSARCAGAGGLSLGLLLLGLLLLGCGRLPGGGATSFKIDFLSSGVARIDPLTHSTAGECLSDHVHRFYGAAGAGALRPEARWRDLLKAAGNTGNVRENKSLYWNPAIYKVLNPDDDARRRFELVDAWFASSYYVWRGGDEEVTAFPNGFKMRATGADLRSRPVATCAPDPEDCERTDAGGCDAWEPSDQAGHGFLPVAACWELEISIVFPTCWDGERKEAADGSHVAFAEDCEQDSDECFDFDCPDTHPVRLPELHLYTRVLNYEGGAHVFSDGSDVFHSDFMSGWRRQDLQRVLDECDNDSEAAMPDAFCPEWLTFRGTPKVEGVAAEEDFDIVDDLARLQPEPALDLQALVSPEEVDGVAALPRGACSGELLPRPAKIETPRQCRRRCSRLRGWRRRRKCLLRCA